MTESQIYIYIAIYIFAICKTLRSQPACVISCLVLMRSAINEATDTGCATLPVSKIYALGSDGGGGGGGGEVCDR